MAVSSTTGGLRTGVCLSTDRPQNPYNGQVIYETDTNRTLVWDNSAWVVVADPALVSFSGTGATVTADAMTVAGENVTPYTGRRNLLYNGAMQVAQRGTSVTGVTGYTYSTVDRWTAYHLSAGTFTVTQDSDAPQGFGKSWKWLCTTATPSLSSGAACIPSQVIEGQDLQGLAYGTEGAKDLTASFWVKSNVTGTYVTEVQLGGSWVGGSYTINSVDTWEYKTVTFSGNTSTSITNDNSAGITFRFWIAAGSNFSGGASLGTTWNTTSNVRAVGQVNVASSVNNYWQATGVQLELGDKATPFEHRSFGEELALCQRYYEKSYNYDVVPGATTSYPTNMALAFNGMTTSSGQKFVSFTYKVQKRAAPTLYSYDGVGTVNKVYTLNLAGQSTQDVSIALAWSNEYSFHKGPGTSTASGVGFHFVAEAEL